jgi:hypothetical protein
MCPETSCCISFAFGSVDKLGMHIAPSIIVFAAFQRILMAIPVVLYLAFTRYVSPNTSHNRIELCFSDGVYQSMNSAGEFCQ